jgi:adenylate kinase family enzyme
MNTVLLQRPDPAHRLRRIVVVGITGSGKTTLAQELSRQLSWPHIELDALYWDPNWTPAPAEVFRARVAEALRGETWVADGNYGVTRDLVWARADTLVWLDYRLLVILWQLTRRMWRRVFTQERLWNGNRERLREHFFSRNSLYLWAFKTYWRRRREYPAHLRQPEFAHLTVVRLRSPKDAEEWRARLPLGQRSILPGG